MKVTNSRLPCLPVQTQPDHHLERVASARRGADEGICDRPLIRRTFRTGMLGAGPVLTIRDYAQTSVGGFMP